MNDITPEQIAKHYSAAMDSVNLINAGKPEGMTDEDWADTVSRNVEHLKNHGRQGLHAGSKLGPA
jgi:hypothetical protein